MLNASNSEDHVVHICSAVTVFMFFQWTQVSFSKCFLIFLTRFTTRGSQLSFVVVYTVCLTTLQGETTFDLPTPCFLWFKSRRENTLRIPYIFPFLTPCNWHKLNSENNNQILTGTWASIIPRQRLLTLRQTLRECLISQ